MTYTLRTVLFVASLAFVSSLGACVVEPDGPTNVTAVEVADPTYGTVTKLSPDDATEPGLPDAIVLGSMCGCQDYECDEQWVTNNVGCDVCVLELCQDGSRHGACGHCDGNVMLYSTTSADTRLAE